MRASKNGGFRERRQESGDAYEDGWLGRCGEGWNQVGFPARDIVLPWRAAVFRVEVDEVERIGGRL